MVGYLCNKGRVNKLIIKFIFIMEILKKLIKKILTDKRMRNTAVLSAFMAMIASAGIPWKDM